MFSIQYLDTKYSPGDLIPIQLGMITDHAYSVFKFTFHCKTACQLKKNLALGMTIFSRNLPDEFDEEQYGIHQDEASTLFPLEIK